MADETNSIESKALKCKEYVEKDCIEDLSKEIAQYSESDLLKIIANKSSSAEGGGQGGVHSRRLISFIEAEIRARNIKESKKFASRTVCATVVIAISAVVSLAIAFFKKGVS